MDISVVMPTFNRSATLARALKLYGDQQGFDGAFEVVVVDDASTDDTADVLSAAAAQAGYPLVHVRLARNSGPAAARNAALSRVRGRVVVFVGDDILPAADFLNRHWRWHTESHPAETDAMVGLIRWADEIEATPLLRWLERSGSQFNYGAMRHGARVDHGCFYTSNASVKRALLDRTGFRFDERLRFCEDSDFALRLERAGMALRHDAEAVAQHLHPTDLTSSLRRMRSLGRSAAILAEASPENFARITSGLCARPLSLRARILRALLAPPLGRLVYTPLARLFERRLIVDRVFALAHASAFLEGLEGALQEGAP